MTTEIILWINLISYDFDFENKNLNRNLTYTLKLETLHKSIMLLINFILYTYQIVEEVADPEGVLGGLSTPPLFVWYL